MDRELFEKWQDTAAITALTCCIESKYHEGAAGIIRDISGAAVMASRTAERKLPLDLVATNDQNVAASRDLLIAAVMTCIDAARIARPEESELIGSDPEEVADELIRMTDLELADARSLWLTIAAERVFDPSA